VISDSHASTIELVRVRLILFSTDPDEITRTLGLPPDELQRDSFPEPRPRFQGAGFAWILVSRAASKDVNVQIRELLARLGSRSSLIREAWRPLVDVLWMGNYFYAGSGPNYEPDVIAGIAAIHGELGQDLYQVDLPDEGAEG
jgi:hypothetical protein